MGKLIPIILLLVGTGAGFGVGTMLAPEPVDCTEFTLDDPEIPEECKAELEAAMAEKEEEEAEETPEVDFVRMNDQFVVPLLEDGVVRALVVLSITLEVDLGASAQMFAIEPKLRDTFLRILFDHANAGGFSGNFTDSHQVEKLRRALLESGQKVAGSTIRDVLILDFLRQEV